MIRSRKWRRPPATADDEGGVLIVAPAVARAGVAHLPRRAVGEPDVILVLVETGRYLDVSPMGPQRSFGVQAPRQNGRGGEVPIGLAEVALKVASHPDPGDARIAIARPLGSGLELLWRASAIGEEELELDGAPRPVVTNLPGA